MDDAIFELCYNMKWDVDQCLNLQMVSKHRGKDSIYFWIEKLASVLEAKQKSINGD